MATYKRKKNKRMRAETTHGWGSKKKHRGAGNRGGKGMAGTGKRADQKKPTILNLYGNSYYGKKGFKRPKEVQHHPITLNLDFLEEHLDSYVAQGLITKQADAYLVDLHKLGYSKLLGKGTPRHKIHLKAASASDTARKKIQEAGGTILP
ncbi:MAG TPA: uL15 family ribosomal protein [Candidatus Nanoarchaeia archaeon]|nr:uL15 family ribosomal protein [Candidatus Nanoarchaeia archaeon]